MRARRAIVYFFSSTADPADLTFVEAAEAVEVVEAAVYCRGCETDEQRQVGLRYEAAVVVVFRDFFFTLAVGRRTEG